LANETVYKPLTEDITPWIKAEILSKLESLYRTGMIDKEMHKFCVPPRNIELHNFISLKKINKNPMGIRPIVSSCSSITENISEYVDIWLQQPMRQLPSFIRDTTDFIQLVEKTILPEECILATIDASSLYHTQKANTQQ